MRKNRFLIAAAVASGVAAVFHFGCIIFGGDWYRFFGAGEEMAKMAEAGHIYPAIVTSVIVGVLSIWSLYALSGAGVIGRLPLLRLGLCIITGVYLLRGVSFIALMPMFPENSLTFWLVSSSVCVVLGLLYGLGVWQSWAYISGKQA